MLFKEIITAYYADRTKHVNTLCGQKCRIFGGIKLGGNVLIIML
jgi:hypothetical protein